MRWYRFSSQVVWIRFIFSGKNSIRLDWLHLGLPSAIVQLPSQLRWVNCAQDRGRTDWKPLKTIENHWKPGLFKTRTHLGLCKVVTSLYNWNTRSSVKLHWANQEFSSFGEKAIFHFGPDLDHSAGDRESYILLRDFFYSSKPFVHQS